MKTTLALAALFILVLGGGYLWKGGTSRTTKNSYDSTTVATSTGISASTTTNSTKNTTPATTAATTGSYTQVQVATHNTSSSCWATINGNVYDLTAWIAQHPGGEGPILGLCGKDGTSAFENQHGTNGRANAELAILKIGVLAK